jgi:putative endonuclease
MKKGGAVYITTNKNHSTLYVGVTSELFGRIQKHKSKYYPNSFSARYNCDKLVYFEGFHSIIEAMSREKQIKAGSRQKKFNLINSINLEWRDLYDDVKDW